jgi:hypothetical protein
MTAKHKKRKGMNDPMVAEDKVPSYEIVEEKIKEIDSTIIISRIFYIFDNLSYRFQLIKKDKMCMVEIPKRLLDDLKNGNPASEQELTEILKLYVKSSECWAGM